MSQIGISSLTTFIDGTPAVANEVNNNFVVVKNAINDNYSLITTLQVNESNYIKKDGSIAFEAIQSYKTLTVTGATNATPIVITSAGHGLSDGDNVYITSVLGNTAANGYWTITKLTDDTFSLNSSAGNGTYTSGGTCSLMPKNPENIANKQYVDQWKQYVDQWKVPTGTVIYLAQSTAPTGFLKANGAAISRTVYSSLFSAIGTTYGIGDGSTTFNLPDLRGEFLRAWDDSRGVDSGRALGSSQSDATDYNSLQIKLINSNANYGSSGFYCVSGSGLGYGGSTIFNADTETRPRNIALLACIKY